MWSALIDVQRVAPCLPGAEITDAQEDGSYQGAFQVKLWADHRLFTAAR